MIYKSCSIEQVIARILRNTRLSDVSFIQDMNEWIPEAMGLMKTHHQLSPAFQDVVVDFHKAKLPCGLISLIGVEYEGKRLPTSSTGKHYTTGSITSTSEKVIPTFISGTIAEPNIISGENSLLWKPTIVSEEDMTQACSCSLDQQNWYQIELDWLNTSIQSGIVRLYFYMYPTDENGFPLIPDQEDYKQAIYYYVKAMMIGAGYEDKVHSYEYLMAMFEKHASRAINAITYPSVDQMMERVMNKLTLSLPINYWHNFEI